VSTASCANTMSMALHGSHHDAQKCSTTRFPGTRLDANSSFDCKFFRDISSSALFHTLASCICFPPFSVCSCGWLVLSFSPFFLFSLSSSSPPTPPPPPAATDYLISLLFLLYNKHQTNQLQQHQTHQKHKTKLHKEERAS
jgi:hypothetical protein